MNEVKDLEPVIFVIGGKARHGKDTLANSIKKELANKNIEYVELQFSDYIKDYAKKISNWDGNDETKPRELLQTLATKVIREQIDKDFFVKEIIKDAKVYSYFFKAIIVMGARMKNEIDGLKNEFKNVVAIKVERPEFDNGLTEAQKTHPTETDLDDYDKFNYIIANDGTIEDLDNKAKDIVDKELV